MIFTIDNGKVGLLPEAMELPEVKALKSIDKTKGKAYFWSWIKYMYYVYHPKGIYENLFSLSRKRTTCVNQLGKDGEYYKEIEEKPEMKALIKWYQEHSMTKEERLLDVLDNDIEKYIEYLQNIPYEREIKVVEKTGDEGGLRTFFKVEENSDEKMKAIKNSKELILYRKELKKLVKETAKKKTGKQFRTRKYEE